MRSDVSKLSLVSILRFALGPALSAVVLQTIFVCTCLYLVFCRTAADGIATLGENDRRGQPSPASLGVQYEEVTFSSETDPLTLHAWLIPASGDRAVILLQDMHRFSYGQEPEAPKLVKAYADAGFTVLLLDLRGRGKSGGNASASGRIAGRDVGGAVRFLETRGVRAGRIGLHGEATMTPQALFAAAALPDVGAVAVVDGVADLRDCVDGLMGRFGLPPMFSPGVSYTAHVLNGTDLDDLAPVRAVPLIAPRPLFIVQSQEDADPCYSEGRRLLSASRNPTDELWVMPAKDGNPIEDLETALNRRLVTFFTRALP